MDTPTRPPNRPDRPKRIRVPITQEDDGSPFLGVEDDIVLIKEGDELIFEGSPESEFDIHFIGRSPVDLSPRGKKYFSSENGKIIIQTDPDAQRTRRKELECDRSHRICQDDHAHEARRKKILAHKRPRRTATGVQLFFDVIIDGIVLDPRLNIDDDEP
ncbi:hypothetical protein [Teredinibacter turnerae]|uniref:hypothetical protein n=1 Tax=Teredinibacter turnerae TaxID=2426 RepID=UPI000366D9D2|nr:hypothetical protein [Teredinibacter turnerae]